MKSYGCSTRAYGADDDVSGDDDGDDEKGFRAVYFGPSFLRKAGEREQNKLELLEDVFSL